MRELSDIRLDINRVDREIQKLFLERMSLAEQVADYKITTGDKVLKPDREQALLDMMREQVPEYLEPEYVSMLKGMIRVSRMRQYSRILEKDPSKLSLPLCSRTKPQTVVYQGLPASYQAQAAHHMFPDAASIDHVATFEDVFRTVAEGRADVGVLPVENSSIGIINEVADRLVQYNLYISHSHVNYIHHCLAGCQTASMETVKQVYSIEPALDQCQRYLKEHSFECCKAANTAVAAQQVRDWNDPARTAVCSRAAAELYGLKVLASEINDDKTNQTRFIAISRSLSAQPEDNRVTAVCSRAAAELYGLKVLASEINDDKTNQTRFIAISRSLSAQPEDNRVSIIFTLSHRHGTLAAALSMFSDHNMNLTEIHSRPLPETPWNYRFHVDLEGSLASDNVRSLIYQLSEELESFRLLGSYRITQTQDQ